ncbi:serine/threonine-protein kinase M1 [Tulasnella sp. 403]|nr:serine/threonine-protein kinase M1 [Tulasnella sp. 403]
MTAINAPRIDTLILDANPIISRTPLRGLANRYLTTPHVVKELRDPRAREYFEQLSLMQGVDVEIRMPAVTALSKVVALAKKTGDYAVLSQPDLCIVALTLECHESNTGKPVDITQNPTQLTPLDDIREPLDHPGAAEEEDTPSEEDVTDDSDDYTDVSDDEDHPPPIQPPSVAQSGPVETMAQRLKRLALSDSDSGVIKPQRPPALKAEAAPRPAKPIVKSSSALPPSAPSDPVPRKADLYEDPTSEDDGEGEWITPANVEKHKTLAKDKMVSEDVDPEQSLHVACMTSDFAMQNLLLRMGLHLVSKDGKKVKKVKTWVLRCHACSKLCKDPSKKFCPSCGNPTLSRATVTLGAGDPDNKDSSNIQVHLSKRFKYKYRGMNSSLPHPKMGHAKGGGEPAIILREDQDEWQRAVRRDATRVRKEEKRMFRALSEKDRRGDEVWMDPDWVPQILSNNPTNVSLPSLNAMANGGRDPDGLPIHVALRSYLDEPHLNYPGRLSQNDAKFRETRAFLIDLMKFLEDFPRVGLWYSDAANTAQVSLEIFLKAFNHIDAIHRGDDGLEREWPLKLFTFVGTMEDWINKDLSPDSLEDGPAATTLRDLALEVLATVVSALQDDFSIIPGPNQQTWRVAKELLVECASCVLDVIQTSATAPFASFTVTLFETPRISEVTVAIEEDQNPTFILTRDEQIPSLLLDILFIIVSSTSDFPDHSFFDITHLQAQAINAISDYCLSSRHRSDRHRAALMERLVTTLAIARGDVFDRTVQTIFGRVIDWRLGETPAKEWDEFDRVLATSIRGLPCLEYSPTRVKHMSELLQEALADDNDSPLLSLCYSYLVGVLPHVPLDQLRLLEEAASSADEDSKELRSLIQERLEAHENGGPKSRKRKRDGDTDDRTRIESVIYEHIYPDQEPPHLGLELEHLDWIAELMGRIQGAYNRKASTSVPNLPITDASFLKKLPCMVYQNDETSCDGTKSSGEALPLIPIALTVAEYIVGSSSFEDSVDLWHAVFAMLTNFMHHTVVSTSDIDKLIPYLERGLTRPERSVRLQAGASNHAGKHRKTAAALVHAIQQRNSPVLPLSKKVITLLGGVIAQNKPMVRETTIVALGLIGRVPDIDVQVSTARDALEAVAKHLDKTVGAVLLPHAPKILAHTLMVDPTRKREDALKFLTSMLVESSNGTLGVDMLLNSYRIEIVTELLIQMADEHRATADMALVGLRRLERVSIKPSQADQTHGSIGKFLRPFALGILSKLNTTIVASRGKANTNLKIQVVRSLGILIQSIGNSIYTIAPQIMALLQSLVTAPDLSEATLETWRLFATTLRFRDFAPHAGSTSAVIVSGWLSFSPSARRTGQAIIDYIFLRNERDIGDYVKEMVSLGNVPELAQANNVLVSLRMNQSLPSQLRSLLDRSINENSNISAQSLLELKAFMISQRNFFQQMASGDVFDGLIGETVKALFHCACRDGDEFEGVRILALDCIGVLGAVDPDRFDIVPEQSTITIVYDFSLEFENTIFILMDHISKWIRVVRQEQMRKRKSRSGVNNPDYFMDQLVQVESLITSIDHDLMAKAAFQTKAYARALMNFEQLVIQKQRQSKSDDELQPYYERLHEIYAHLDEPDGMQGISSLVLSPSLEHQIREHESTGRWTSAQSCWEIKLQRSPDDIELHLGLLRCLRNLGHYGTTLFPVPRMAVTYSSHYTDTLETHIRGVLSKHPDWSEPLVGFRVEGSWMVGDWNAVQEIVRHSKSTAPEINIARVLMALKSQNEQLISLMLGIGRKSLGAPILAAGRESYRRSYDTVVRLHLIHELEMIHDTAILIRELQNENRDSRALRDLAGLTSNLSMRLESTLPTFRSREPILSMHRTALSMMLPDYSAARREIGRTWLTSAKIARKAGHAQTAYSAVLQAQQMQDPFAFIQSCKLVKDEGESYRALQDLESAISRIPSLDSNYEDENTKLTAKALLLRARWRHETDRFGQKEIVQSFKDSFKTLKDWESPYFHLGRYYDSLRAQTSIRVQIAYYTHHTCRHFSAALSHGSKYIFQTMPRLLTLWLDMSEEPDLVALERSGGQPAEDLKEVHSSYLRISQVIDGALSSLPRYQWYTAFPQIVSRIEHPSKSTFHLLSKIVAAVITAYPGQALWLFTSVVQSRRPERRRRGTEIIGRIKGKTFAIPERVPFRLTNNIIGGMGVSGVEGVFRVACEVTMQLLRLNKDALMSVLEAFVHDPLVEWEDERRKEEGRKRGGRRRAEIENPAVQLRALAQKSLLPIQRKLSGLPSDLPQGNWTVKEITTSNQVEHLIKEATSAENLSMMYYGWAPWL